MSLVAFFLYIIINLRKESDNNPKMHIALEIYMFQVYLTHQKTYMLFVTLILYLYIMRRTKSDKMSLIAYHCNRYIYIMFLVYSTMHLVIIMTLYLYFIKVKFRQNIQNANIKNVNF